MEHFIIAALMAPVSAILGYYAFLNFRQSALLSRPVTLDQLPRRIGKVVCVYGTPNPVEPLHLKFHRSPRMEVLWYRIEQQEKVHSGRRSHWSTVSVKEKRTDFMLEFPGGGSVYVHCAPTEVQNPRESTAGSGGIVSARRTIRKWLPVRTNLTVLGRLIHKGEQAEIITDAREGMFLSAAPPKIAAQRERFKAWMLAAGTAGCIALALAVLVFKPNLTKRTRHSAAEAPPRISTLHAMHHHAEMQGRPSCFARTAMADSLQAARWMLRLSQD